MAISDASVAESDMRGEATMDIITSRPDDQQPMLPWSEEAHTQQPITFSEEIIVLMPRQDWSEESSDDQEFQQDSTPEASSENGTPMRLSAQSEPFFPVTGAQWRPLSARRDLSGAERHDDNDPDEDARSFASAETLVNADEPPIRPITPRILRAIIERDREIRREQAAHTRVVRQQLAYLRRSQNSTRDYQEPALTSVWPTPANIFVDRPHQNATGNRYVPPRSITPAPWANVGSLFLQQPSFLPQPQSAQMLQEYSFNSTPQVPQELSFNSVPMVWNNELLMQSPMDNWVLTQTLSSADQERVQHAQGVQEHPQRERARPAALVVPDYIREGRLPHLPENCSLCRNMLRERVAEGEHSSMPVQEASATRGAGQSKRGGPSGRRNNRARGGSASLNTRPGNHGRGKGKEKASNPVNTKQNEGTSNQVKEKGKEVTSTPVKGPDVDAANASRVEEKQNAHSVDSGENIDPHGAEVTQALDACASASENRPLLSSKDKEKENPVTDTVSLIS